MKQKRMILAFGLLASTAAWAQKTDGLILKTGDTEQQFEISEVKEIKFSDEGLIVVKTDEATIEFASDWQIRFCEVEATSISQTKASDGKGKAKVYNAEGKLVKEAELSDLRISKQPKGVYIIMCNGKSLKVSL